MSGSMSQDKRWLVANLPIGLGAVSLVLVVAGLGADIWSVLDCGGDFEFGWKETHTDGAPSYADCEADSSLLGDKCDDLRTGGEAALAFGLLAIFSLVPALGMYFKGRVQGDMKILKWSIFLFAVSAFCCMISFSAWLGNGHSAVKDISKEDPECSANIGATTNLMIASFVFLLLSTFLSIGFYARLGPYGDLE
eukprot:TRINITY_DN19956_c0_g1_i1.p1 TRINITY_DN19956_c0_g1~~TRINITY_DN19956_c0_g1_i1.p1  ORF type:complete len:194 (-),score=28.24 TRINITY_DN19956_c0_g1_i1:73-654(-)